MRAARTAALPEVKAGGGEIVPPDSRISAAERIRPHDRAVDAKAGVFGSGYVAVWDQVWDR